MKTYRDLQVWQKSMTLVTEIYKISKGFSKDEAYGLTSQMRRCAISIPSNIAEGYGRNSIQVGTEVQRGMKTYRDLQVWQKKLCASVPLPL